jgi:hypothetical protein
MLLQLTYMVLPLRRWDWARYLGSAALPIIVIAKTDSDHGILTADDGLFFCGIFTFGFTLLFQARLLPRLGEGMILMWTAVLLCVIVEMGAWGSAASYLALAIGVIAVAVLIFQQSVPYFEKILVYAWFLLAVVIIAALQFRRSDFSLMLAGGADRLDYRLAVVDGMAGAYIGVHASLLFELLPIPRKGEPWAEFKTRWRGYLDLVASRVDDQRLNKAVAIAVVLGIGALAYANNRIGIFPDRALVNLVLILLPILWRIVSLWLTARQSSVPSEAAVSASNAAAAKPISTDEIGRQHHSKKHR